MSYQLEIRNEQGYLHVRVTGTNSIETVKSYLTQVRQECRRRNCNQVLIEEHLDGPGLALLEIFEIASRYSEPIDNHFWKVAYVDTNSEHSYLDMKFAQTVSNNRGLNVRIFPSVVEAEKWISGKQNIEE